MKNLKLKMYVDKIVYKDPQGKELNKLEQDFCEEEGINMTEEFVSEVKEVTLIFNELPPMMAYRGKHSSSQEDLTVVEGLVNDVTGNTVLFNLVATPDEFVEMLKSV